MAYLVQRVLGAVARAIPVLSTLSEDDDLGERGDLAIWADRAALRAPILEPPSLFDFVQRTGFDIESLIFCFAIGGVGAVLYNIATNQDLRPLGREERTTWRHHYHRIALLVPVVAFPILCLTPVNPIYSAIAAMAFGGAATAACRPDLKSKTLIGGCLFAVYYAIFMLLLEWSAPGYIARVWNLRDLWGVVVGGVPLEELLFGFAFGTYWSGIFEHLTWRGLVEPSRGPGIPILGSRSHPRPESNRFRVDPHRRR